MRGKRKSILETAEHEFLEKGYEGTSIDAIVKEVGGSKSTIYAYFRDKSVLFAETLANIQRELDFSLERAARESPATLREALILAGIELLTTLYSERALHLFRTVIAESNRFPEVARQLATEGMDAAIARIGEIIEHHQADGSLAARTSPPEDTSGPHRTATSRPPAAPPDAAREFVALLRGDTHLRLLMGVDPIPKAKEIAAMAERATDRFLRGAG